MSESDKVQQIKELIHGMDYTHRKISELYGRMKEEYDVTGLHSGEDWNALVKLTKEFISMSQKADAIINVWKNEVLSIVSNAPFVGE